MVGGHQPQQLEIIAREDKASRAASGTGWVSPLQSTAFMAVDLSHRAGLPAPRLLIEVRKYVCGRHRPNRELQGAGNFHTMRVTKTCLGSLLSAKGVNLRSSPLDRRSSCIGHSVSHESHHSAPRHRSGRSVSCLHKASPGLCADLWQSASIKESLIALTRRNALASGFSAIERTVGEAHALRVKMQPDVHHEHLTGHHTPTPARVLRGVRHRLISILPGKLPAIGFPSQAPRAVGLTTSSGKSHVEPVVLLRGATALSTHTHTIRPRDAPKAQERQRPARCPIPVTPLTKAARR